tara:strand:+ start:294 stop:704 length:411 start_codon:yes stop_codon:yes gene_type:complete
MVSPLRLLLKDGTKNAFIQDGVIVAPGSKFDGTKASESNLMKAIDKSGSEPTNLNNYKMQPINPDIKMKQPTSFQPQYAPVQNIAPIRRSIAGRPTGQSMNRNTMMPNTNSSPSVINKGQRQQLMNLAMLGKLGLI